MTQSTHTITLPTFYPFSFRVNNKAGNGRKNSMNLINLIECVMKSKCIGKRWTKNQPLFELNCKASHAQATLFSLDVNCIHII